MDCVCGPSVDEVLEPALVVPAPEVETSPAVRDLSDTALPAADLATAPDARAPDAGTSVTVVEIPASTSGPQGATPLRGLSPFAVEGAAQPPAVDLPALPVLDTGESLPFVAGKTVAPLFGAAAPLFGTQAPTLAMTAPILSPGSAPGLGTRESQRSRAARLRLGISPQEPVPPVEKLRDSGGTAASGGGAGSSSSAFGGAFAILVVLSLAGFWLVAFCFPPTAWRPVACLLLIERPG